jgi:predicted metal-dependent phosphoesterase TrpH
VNIDLHIHTNYSDGSLSPSEIVAAAQHYGLAAIAITDHDCISGAKEVLESVDLPPSLSFITGIEISASFPPGFTSKGSLHILGYGFDIDDSDLNNTLKILQNARENRNPEIIRKLNQMGVPIELREVSDIAGDSVLGRPHIAQALVQKKVVNSIDDAFTAFLGYGQPAYVDKYRIEAQKAIDIIRQAGGVPVLAHPYLITSGDRGNALETLLNTLIDMGLGGLEVFYSEHTPQQTHYFSQLCQRYQLIMTGGSDFHGQINDHIQMGIGKGNLSVPFRVYERLMKAVARSQKYLKAH